MFKVEDKPKAWIKELYDDHAAVWGGFSIYHDNDDSGKYKMAYRSGILNTGFQQNGSFMNSTGSGYANDGYHERGDGTTKNEKTLCHEEIIAIRGLYLLQWVYGKAALRCRHECYTITSIVKAYDLSIEGLSWNNWADKEEIQRLNSEVFQGTQSEMKRKFDKAQLGPKICLSCGKR